MSAENSLLSILLILALLAINAFFVAAEFALVKARGAKIETRAKDGNRAAIKTIHIQKNLEAYLAACQLGITMASLGLGWIGEPAVAALLKPVLIPLSISESTLHLVSFAVGFIVFSSLHIVIGEQVPKTYAIRKAEPVSLLVSYPLHAFFILFYPLNWALNFASRSILSLLKIEEVSHAEVLSNDEIRGLIDDSAQFGDMDEGRAEMFHNLFRFDERSVERVMIPRLEADVLRIDKPAEENAEIIKSTKHSRFPVIDGDLNNLIGMILTKDFLNALLDGEQSPWSELNKYIREPLVIPETLKVSKLFEKMRTERAHMACVVDEYGSFVGLITLEDLIEEIVGEIADEVDDELPEFAILKKGDNWEAHGLAPLADVERVIGYSVDDHFNANTLSGLIMNKLERIPEVGDEIVDNGYKFQVLEVKDRRVERLIIEPDGSSGSSE